MLGKGERSEKLHLKMELNGERLSEGEVNRIQKWAKIIRKGNGEEPNIDLGEVVAGATYELTYDLTIDYYNCVFAISKFIEWADCPGCTLRVDTSELNHQRCLVQEWMCKLEQIEQKYKEVK